MATVVESQEMELRQELADLKSELGTVMQHLKNIGASEGRMISRRLHDTQDRAVAAAKSTQTAMEKHIESRPLQSILLAFGTGWLISLLLTGRR